jgi:ribosome-associated protein
MESNLIWLLVNKAAYLLQNYWFKKCIFANANLKINMAIKIDATNILLENIINAIQDVKGQGIISLDLRKLDTAISKYFVICTGNSNTQVKAIEGSIKKSISKNLEEKPFNVEGSNIGEWILMDYSDIIVHIFQEKTRNFYNIEDFWGDAKVITYKD